MKKAKLKDIFGPHWNLLSINYQHLCDLSFCDRQKERSHLMYLTMNHFSSFVMKQIYCVRLSKEEN